jgi:hypothetical protein
MTRVSDLKKLTTILATYPNGSSLTSGVAVNLLRF